MRRQFFTFLLILSGITAFGQMNYAPFMPKTFRANDLAFTNIPSAPFAPYHVSNAMYDELGNVLFYTYNEFVLDAASNVLDDDLVALGDDVTDMVIVPKPGTCNKFYIIYVGYRIAGPQSSLRYMEVTVSGSTVTTSPFVNVHIEANHHGSVAVSKRLVSGDRYLYYGSPTGIRKYNVTNSGISLVSLITSTGVYSNELELNESSTGWKLLWAGNTSGSAAGLGNKLNIQPLNTSGNNSGAITSVTIGGGSPTNSATVKGIEFLSSTVAFASVFYGIGNASNGIYRVTLSTGTAPVLTGSANYGITQLEKYGGAYYALGTSIIGGAATLGRFTLSSVAAVPGSPSVSNWAADAFYYMPRGVDGENYNTILNGTGPHVAATWASIPCVGNTVTANITSPQPGTTYTWYSKCGTTYTSLGTGNSKVITIASGCSYVVRAVTSSGCSSLASPSWSGPACPADEIKREAAAAVTGAFITPNPSRGIFNLSLASKMNMSQSPADVKLYNMQGQLLLQKRVAANTTVQFDLSAYASDTYLIRAEQDGKMIYTEKLVLQK
jgi:Secretion system C-terminal sorting domain/Ig-like domain CHU_C associated